MKIAIIGGGISGLVAAYRLNPDHEITLYEANDYVGGHTHTVNVPVGQDRSTRPIRSQRIASAFTKRPADEPPKRRTLSTGKAERDRPAGDSLAIDTGFIVYNRRTYPHFTALLAELGVASQPTEMSFSVADRSRDFEYNGHSLGGLFACRRNVLCPRFYRFLSEIVRFNRLARELVENPGERTTVAEFLAEHRFSSALARDYLYPMGSAIWSCPIGDFGQFPIRFVAEFYRNHGLLDLRDRPQWYVITGGSQRYVEVLTRSFAARIRLADPVLSVERQTTGVCLTSRRGGSSMYDHVIFACHSDQALRMLGTTATRPEREVLCAFPYVANRAILHTDTSVLPRRRRAWASWNYQLHSDPNLPASVTYNMNILQRLPTATTYCVSLNPQTSLRSNAILGEYIYHHPVFTSERAAAQARWSELARSSPTVSFCGAYWGNGFHEDGVVSALAVVESLRQRRTATDLGWPSAKTPSVSCLAESVR